MLEEKKIQKLNMIHEVIDSGSYVSRIRIYSDKFSSNINDIVDNVLDKHKKSQKVISQSWRRLPWKQIVSVALVLFMLLAAIPYVLPPLYGDFGSDVSVVLDPDGVRLNETMFINMTIPSSYNIKSARADMAGVDTVDLLLVDNSTSLHLWSSVWLVHGLVPDEYIMTITAMDEYNMSYSAGVRLSILAEEVPPVDNESYIPDENETVPPEINDVNETSNETIIPVELNLLLQSDKDVYIVNETVLIQGVVTYNNSLINTSVGLLMVGPDYNSPIRLEVIDGRFNYEFIPDVIGSYVANVTVSYLNESVQDELVFDVKSVSIENVSLYVSSLLVWDDSDYQVYYVGDQVTFYANYSSVNGSIENASCLITFNVGGWTSPVIMNFVDGLYVYNRSFDFNGTFDYQVLSSAEGYENKTISSEFVITKFVSNISIVDTYEEEKVFALPGTSFYIERTIDGLIGTETVFASLFSEGLNIEKIEISRKNITTGQLSQISRDTAPHVFVGGRGVTGVEKKIDNLRENLPVSLKSLDHISYSKAFNLIGPVTVRVWFKAPSWEDIKSGVAPSSGSISYLVFSEFGDDYDFESSTWWNSGWLNRKLITVNCSQVYDVLSNFPILINTTDSDLANDAQDDGDDIAFVLYSDNTTKLNHEIEWFNGTNGNLIAWINVTSINSTQNTKIWMYYGNSVCNNQQNPTGVWDSNFIAVWHLNETSGTVYDSTSNNRDSSAVVGVNQNAIGMVDGGDSFDGTNDYIEITMTLPSTVTISAWGTYTGTNKMLWCIDSDNQGPDLFFVSGVICLNTWDSAGNPFCSIPANVNQWYLYTTVIQSGNTYLYLNDQLGGSATYRNPTGSDFHISSSAGYDWQGMIDEVQISNIARNSSWIKTSYNTVVNSSIFISVGSEELSSPILSSPVPSDGATGIFVPPSSFNITVSDPNLDNINITWRTNASGSWVTFNTTGGGSGVPTGTYNVTYTSWVSSYATKYWWSVNVTDGILWTNATYNFTTKPENYAPTISSVYPSNSSTGIDLQVTCSIKVNDAEEDSMTVYWFNSSDGVSYNYQQINSSVNSGETVYWNYTQANTILTTYYWKVAVNDTKDNSTAWYRFTTRSGDITKPSSNLTTIPQYWYSSSSNPLTITCTDAQDNTGGDGLKNVTLYYYYSTDNNTWNGPCNFGVDADPWIQCSWSFTFSNSTGYYRFYSRATDNASPANIEDPPITNDTKCGYDVQSPSSSVDSIVPYNVTSSPLAISSTASDSHSNVKNVTLWYRYSTENSSWWNDNWLNRKPINFNVSSGSTSSNYQVLLNITYISGMNTNFSDLRFVNYSNNSKELDYWIESKSDENWANVWLEIDSPINTSNQSLAWMYYGNPSASTNSNGTNTFVFFDDFDSFDTNKWTSTGSYSISSSQLTITTGAVYTDNTISSQPGLISEAKIKWNNFAGYSGLEIANAQSTSGSNGGQNKLAYLMTNSGGSSSVTAWAADGTTTSYNIVSGTAQFSATAGTTYILGHAVTTSNVIFYRDRTQTNSYSGTWSNTIYLWLGYFTGSTSGTNDISDIVTDWVLVRKYSSTNPTYYIGNEIWTCWNNASNPDTSSPWSWIFDFPDGLGYYDFHSIANDTMGNKEDAPTRADSKCYYNQQNTSINITPTQWNIGTTTIGNYNYSTSGYYFNLTNNGTVTLDIQIKASNATNTTTGAVWNLSTTPGFDNYSLQYNKSGGTWTNINQTYSSFIASLGIGSWQTFDLNIFMATTSTKSDPLSVTITFRSVIP